MEPGFVQPDRQYVLFVATDVGLGHLLSALLNSAYYAWRTGRALALDMRAFHYVSGDKHAGFFEHFALELPPDLEVITDLTVIDRLRQDADLHFLRIDSERLDVAQPFTARVLLIPCLVPGQPYSVSTKRPDIPFHINLRGALLAAWQQVMRRPEWSGPVIGLHYRSTVGEVTERMTKAITPDYEERYRAVKDKYITAALAVAAQAGYANPAFLVTSDDMDFVSYVRERLPRSFSLATRLPDQEWAAWVRAHGHDFSIMSEAVNDLWCLSACDRLLHYRSGFTDFAILNSRKLDAATTHYVHVPALKEILDSLAPDAAVAWARGAVRKAGIRRLQQRYLFDWLADALDRVGDTAAAARERQRAQWHWESHHHPVMDNPDKPRIEAQARRGDFSGVVERAQRAVRELPGNPFWLSGYGESLSNVLVQAGRFEEAAVAARQAVAIEPDDAFLHEQLGVVLIRAGAFDEAAQAIGRAIEIDPEIGRFHATLGDCLMRQGRGPEAVAAFQVATRLEPDDPHMMRQLGDALLRTGDNAGAATAFRRALSLRVEAGPHIELSDALARQGRLAESMTHVQAAIDLQPTNPNWHNRMAHLLLLAKLPAAAETAARTAISHAPDDVAFHDTLVTTLQRQGREQTALAELERMVQRAPNDAQTRVRLARAMLVAEYLDAAETELQRAAALAPGRGDVHELLSFVLERQGRRAEAIAATRRAIALLPDDLGRQHRLAKLLIETTDYAAAEHVLHDATPLAATVTSFHHQHLLSIVFERQGRLPETVIAARKASAVEPDNADLLVRLARLLLAVRQYDEAELVAHKALTLRPDDQSLQQLVASVGQQRRTGAQLSEQSVAPGRIPTKPPTPLAAGRGGDPVQESGSVPAATRRSADPVRTMQSAPASVMGDTRQ